MEVRHGDMKALNGLRAVCCLLVITGHARSPLNYLFLNDRNRDDFAIPVEFLQSVSLFFLLSGQSLARFYSHSKDLETSSGRLKFVLKRIARLAPTYFVALLLDLPFFIRATSSPLIFGLSAVLSPLALQSIIPHTTLWCGPLWQVSVLMTSYILYALYFEQWISRASNSALWLAAAVCCAFPISMVSFVMTTGDPLELLTGLRVTTFQRVPHFILGAILGEAIERAKKDPTKFRWGIVADSISVFLLATVVGAALAGSIDRMVYAFFEFLIEVWAVPVHALWIFALVMSDQNGSLTAKFLCLRPLAWIADASFASYAFHMPIIQYAAWFIQGRILQDVPEISQMETWQSLSVIPASVIIGRLFNSFVNEPFRTRANKLIQKLD